jgi:hypothetical protein
MEEGLKHRSKGFDQISRAYLVKLKSPKNFHTSAAFKVNLKTQHMPTPASFLLPASSLTPESSRHN